VRSDVISELVREVVALPEGRRLVAIDGVDGSGKTVFACELAAALRAVGEDVVEVHVDDFHHLRSRRYQRGRVSAEGFWLDSYDYGALERDVLSRLQSGGSGLYRWGATDLERDVLLDIDPAEAPADAVVLVEGIFLHRDELAHWWDYSVFLDVPFEETARRMALRDGAPEDPNGLGRRRYVDGQRLYFRSCHPWERASVVIDNRDWSVPRIVRAMEDGSRPLDT
jgi:uridine kinase